MAARPDRAGRPAAGVPVFDKQRVVAGKLKAGAVRRQGTGRVPGGIADDDLFRAKRLPADKDGRSLRPTTRSVWPIPSVTRAASLASVARLCKVSDAGVRAALARPHRRGNADAVAMRGSGRGGPGHLPSPATAGRPRLRRKQISTRQW